MRIVADENLNLRFFSGEKRFSVRPQRHRKWGQTVHISIESGLRIALTVDNCLHPAGRPCVDKKMYRKRRHQRIAAERPGLKSCRPFLPSPAFVDPAFKAVLRIIKEIMHIAGLCTDDCRRRPILFFLIALRKPFLRISPAHKRNGVQSFCAEFSASAVPSVLYSDPVAPVKLAHVNSVAVIPRAVAMIVGKRAVRRVIISVDVFYRPVGIEHTDGIVTRAENRILLGADKMTERIIVSVCHRLVYIRNENARRMRAYQLFHLLALTDYLCKFCPSYDGKQREIGLKHKPDSVTKVIYFFINGTLRYAQKVHIACFCHKHIIKQLLIIPSENVLLFKAHCVCAAQTDAFAVQIKHALRLALLVDYKRSHSERFLRRIGFSSFYI